MGDEAWILAPLGAFAMVVAIVVGPAWLKSRERREMQATVRHALDKGQPLPPELIDAISRATPVKPPATAHSDLRIGAIWLAVALGLAAFGYFVSFQEADAAYPMIGIAAIPGFIGLAFIILSFFNKTKD